MPDWNRTSDLQIRNLFLYPTDPSTRFATSDVAKAMTDTTGVNAGHNIMFKKIFNKKINISKEINFTWCARLESNQ